MDRLTSMAVFTRVVETKSFTAAAQQLQISRAMASKHVQELEERLGVKLLHRTTRSLSLTEAGGLYYERCRHVLEAVRCADEEASNKPLSASGRLRVAAPVSFGTSQISPLIPEFLNLYPEVRLDLVLSDRIIDLLEEGFDLAIRVGNLPETGLVVRRLAATRLVTCAAPSYLAQHGTPSRPQELKDHHCLSFALSLGNEWSFANRDGAATNVQVGELIACNNCDALRLMALEGAGIVQQPSFIVNDDIAAGRLVPILGGFPGRNLGVHALYPSHQNAVPKVRAFVEHLATAFSLQPWARDAAMPVDPAAA